MCSTEALLFKMIVGEGDVMHDIFAVYPCCTSENDVESPW